MGPDLLPLIHARLDRQMAELYALVDSLADDVKKPVKRASRKARRSRRWKP